jgi:hypothetical protein
MAGGLVAIGATVAIFVSVRDMKRRQRTNELKQPTHPTLQLKSPPRRRWQFSVAYRRFPAAAPPLLRWPTSWDAITPSSYTALIGLLFWPTSRDNKETTRRADVETTIPAFKPNGSDEASPSLYRH